MTTPLLIIVASLGGAGVCVIIASARRVAVETIPGGVADHRHRTTAAAAVGRHRLRQALMAAGAGVLAYLATGWPIAVPLCVVAVVGLRGLGGRPAGQVIDKLDAIAAWTEMLRDTLAGAAGLTQALVATALTCPQAIREEVTTLAHRLCNGVALTTALRKLAEKVADPAMDVVVAALLMAATERGQRLGDLLGALAESTREEVAMRQGVEASRSPARSAVRTVTGCSLGFVGLIALFARPYLAPYRTVTGQVVLVLVGALFGLGLWLMAAMVRLRPSPRLFVPDSTT